MYNVPLSLTVWFVITFCFKRLLSNQPDCTQYTDLQRICWTSAVLLTTDNSCRMQCLCIYQLVDPLRNFAELCCIAFFCRMYYFHHSVYILTYCRLHRYQRKTEILHILICQVALHLTFFSDFLSKH